MLYLQARAQSVGRILIGFYQLPDSAAQPIDFVVNPEGNELRSKLRRVHPFLHDGAHWSVSKVLYKKSETHGCESGVRLLPMVFKVVF